MGKQDVKVPCGEFCWLATVARPQLLAQEFRRFADVLDPPARTEYNEDVFAEDTD